MNEGRLNYSVKKNPLVVTITSSPNLNSVSLCILGQTEIRTDLKSVSLLQGPPKLKQLYAECKTMQQYPK